MLFRKINIKIILLIVAGSSILGLVYNGMSNDGIPWFYIEKEYQNLSSANSDVPNSPLLISLDQAINFFDDENVTFIDARDRWDFSDGHIAGAINLPEYSFDPTSNQVKSLNKNNTFVIYCGGDDCDTSKRLAEYLTKLEFSKLFIYTGGFTEWTALELPVEKL